MHSDFYTFAREPDPLYSTNLVQQLLSNNSAVNANQASMGGAGTDTSQFDGTVSGFGHIRSGSAFVHGGSNPHVEASQILQALSSAGESGKK
jgi:hypothetical protein